MQYAIRQVDSDKMLRSFIRIPYSLYRDDSKWIPPLLAEEKTKFSTKRNPMLHHCDCAHFLLYGDGKPVGRASAFVDRLALEHWGEAIGLFGSYECVDDPNGSSMLLNAARNWLKDKRMERMRGPWSFASQEWGAVIQGSDLPPMIMAPYNFAYYSRQFESFGLKKAKDLLVYEVDVSKGYTLPGRYLESTDRIAKKYGIILRPLNMKNLQTDVQTIVDIANRSTRNNWGFVPVTEEEARDMARSLKPVVDPNLVMIAEAGKRPVGYLIALPDINVVLKNMHGRLFPFGLFRMLLGLRKIRQYRIWALGVVPEYQRRALDTLFYRKLYEVLLPRHPGRVEANYVLEDNMAMNNPILKMGFRHVKTYRVYEMEIG